MPKLCRIDTKFMGFILLVIRASLIDVLDMSDEMRDVRARTGCAGIGLPCTHAEIGWLWPVPSFQVALSSKDAGAEPRWALCGKATLNLVAILLSDLTEPILLC